MTFNDAREAAPARAWPVRGAVALLRGTALGLLAPVGLVLFVLLACAASLMGLGIGVFLLPPAVFAIRAMTNWQRKRITAWTGLSIPEPYLELPAEANTLHLLPRLLADRATWRDTAWLLADASLGYLLTLAPLVILLNGLRGLLMPVLYTSLDGQWLGDWYVFLPVDSLGLAWLTAPLGLLHLPLALWVAPYLLHWHAALAAKFLSPASSTVLARRVQHLITTRDDAVGREALELRRIERNLHDGAQARLVAMGMTLDAAARLTDAQPEAAKSLLAEAKENSVKALQELRDLVRGIQPPVLVDRGLGDAIRALAMESPLRLETSIDLPSRFTPAVETAAYFTVSEVLNNAMKHSGADSGMIDARHAAGRLSVTVTDYGRGGADPAKGTGLQALERRLAPLDGFLTVLSPAGGPTVVVIEIPCVPVA
jgi:signal transduction histidine kinase